MKKNWLLVGLIGVVACGEAKESGMLPDPGRPYEADEVYPQQAMLIDTIQWRSESIQFFNADPIGEEPVIMMVRNTTLTDGDILLKLEKQVNGPVTPAELWRAITELEDVPETLALDHSLRAQRGEFSPDYRDFDMSLANAVEKAQPIDLGLAHKFFPFLDNQHCWNSRKQFSVEFGGTTGHPDAYICSSSQPAGQPDSSFVRFSTVTLATACPTSFNTTGTVRVAAADNVLRRTGTQSDITQVCFDVGNGWTCQDTSLIFPQTMTTSDLGGDANHPHRLALGVHSQGSFSAITFASGRLLSSPPKSSTDGFCP